MITATLWDTLGWGGETQALIYNPHTGKVIGVNALGVAPAAATPEFYRSKGYECPPEFGPLAAVTPGTPGGIMVMLTEYGTLSDTLPPMFTFYATACYAYEILMTTDISRARQPATRLENLYA